MRCHSYIWVAACVLLGIVTSSPAGQNLYVDQNHAQANDSNPGTEALPLKTIDRALTLVQPGDTVYLKGGADADDPLSLYDRSGKDGLAIQRPGTAGNKITIAAYPGQTVILQGNYDGPGRGSFGINLDQASYHIFRGIIFRKFNKATEGFATGKTDITLDRCEFTDTTETGLRLRYVSNFTMTDCYVHHCFEAGICFYYQGSNILLKNVTSSYNDDLRGADGDGDGFHIQGPMTGTAVFINCTAVGNSEDGFDLTASCVLINCVSENHTCCGVKFWRRSDDNYAPKANTMVNCLITGNGETGIKVSEGAELHLYNSTIYHNGEEGVAFRALSGNTDTTPIHSTIVNTILANHGYEGIGVDGPSVNIVDADHNLYYSNAQNNNGLHTEANSVTGQDPLFFGPASELFELRAASPAVDTGRTIPEVENLFTTYATYFPQGVVDREGNARPFGLAWDIGAEERTTTAGNTPPVFTSAPQVPPYELHVNEGQPLTVQFAASDPQSNALVFFLAGGATAGMQIDAATGRFSFTPTYDQGGNTSSPQHSYDVTVGVTDQYFAEPAAQTTMRIVVGNVNRAPTYDGLERYTLVAGRPWRFGIPATDADGDTISYTLTGAPSSVVFDGAQGTLSWSPAADEVGPHSVEVTLSDGAAQATQTVVFEVLPQEPYAVPTDEAQIFYVDGANGNNANTGQTEATAWKTLSKAAASLTAGQMVLVRGGTYHEAVTCHAGSPGQPIIFRAYPGESPILDGTGLSARGFRAYANNVFDGFTIQNFYSGFDLRSCTGNLVIVNCVIPNTTSGGYGLEGFAGDDLRVENVQLRNIGDRGIYGTGTNVHLYNVLIDTVPDRGISMAGSTVDNLTIVNSEIAHAGRYGVLLGGRNVFIQNTRIHDNAQTGAELDARHNFLIDSSIWNTSLFGGSAFNLRLGATSKSWVLDTVLTQSARYGVYVASTARGYLADTIVSNNSQQNALIAAGGSLTDASSLSPDPMNHAPVFAGLDNQSVSEKASLNFSVAATDADEDGLTFSAINLPPGASFDPATRAFAWTPTNRQSGTYQVAFRVSDGKTIVFQPVTITVTHVPNHAPVLATGGNQSVNEGAELSFSVSATDQDGDSLQYSAVGLPQGASFANQVFNWTPDEGQEGTYAILFTVSDGELTDTKKATITVARVVDTTPPVAHDFSPSADAIQAPLNSLITLAVSDEGAGVDASTVIIRVNGQQVYSGGGSLCETEYGVCRRVGTAANYRYLYRPANAFAFNQQVTIQVNASDAAGNVMPPVSYHFTTEMWSFGQNRPVSSAEQSSGHPASATDSQGNLWAVWHAGSANARDIYMAKRNALTLEWEAPVQLTNLASDQCNPVLAVGPDDSLYVVWQDNRQGNWDIYASACAPGGTWQNAVRLTNSSSNQTNPAVAVDSAGRVYVAWQDDSVGNQDIYLASCSNAFASVTITQITSSAAGQTDPALAIGAGDTVYLVWTDRRNGAADIYGSSSSASSWANTPLVTGPGNQTQPALAVEPGTSMLHLVWVDDGAGNLDVMHAASNGLPGSPLTGTNLADDASGADQAAPSIVAAKDPADNTHVYACWQDSRSVSVSHDTDIYFVEIRSGATETNVFVDDDGTNSSQSDPVLGVDGCGQPIVLWTDGRGNTPRIYSAGSTYCSPQILASGAIVRAAGGRVGTDPLTIHGAGDVSIQIPAYACDCDMTISIAEIRNYRRFAAPCLAGYEIGSSGLQFASPATVTIPYAGSSSGGQVTPYWYDPQTGTLSQEGMTEITRRILANRATVVSFKTTHLTTFYLLDNPLPGGSTGGGGGGCALAPVPGSDAGGYLLPYAGLALYMLVLRWKDRRHKRA